LNEGYDLGVCLWCIATGSLEDSQCCEIAVVAELVFLRFGCFGDGDDLLKGLFWGHGLVIYKRKKDVHLPRPWLLFVDHGGI
jgi:hypothetical protein